MPVASAAALQPRCSTVAVCSASVRLALHRVSISRHAPERSFLERQRRQRRQRPPAAATGSSQSESPLLKFAEVLGYTGDDPGHWNLSPEWWGTQGGGWGRNAGTTVFAADSECGNGRVTVTAHPVTADAKAADSSTTGSGSTGSSWEEWRVLRFNDVTRQTVMRVHVTAPARSSGNSSSSSSSSSTGREREPPTVVAQADCLAQEYLKTAASVMAALLGLQQLDTAAASHANSGTSNGSGNGGRDSSSRLRALCIGVGGGSLPLFLAHHYPGMDIDAVELDPAVVAAATVAMGLPTDQINLQLHCADAAAFLQQRQQQQQQQPYDLVFMDAFDGEDNVPATLCTPEFASLLASALHPEHGLFLLNLHSLQPGDPVAATFKAALLGQGSSGGSNGSTHSSNDGTCFTVATQRQRNVCFIAARTLQLPAEGSIARRQLQEAAVHVAGAAGYRFPAGSRACQEFRPL